jgi:beta-lactamase class C
MAISCLCLLPAGLHAADAPKEISGAVNRAVGPLMKEYDVPGLVLAVTVGGQHYFFNYGVASKAARTPVTEDTLFEIGSVSKTFTAVLAGYVQTLGKLSFDDHPSKFMPELRHSAVDAATLLNLGTFTAGGLPLQFPDDLRTDAEMKTYFRQWKPSAKADTERQYSNPSIGLLGHIAALAMKKSFSALVETDIFPRLGLRQSYVHVPAAAMHDYAWGYNKAGKPIRVNPGMFDAEAYGVKSSAADMIRFVDANIRPDTVDEPSRRAVEGTHIGYFKSGELVQGLGWEQYPYPVTLERLLAGNATTMTMDAHAATRLTPPRSGAEPTLFNKTGSTNGFSAYVAFVPVKKIGLVLLANKNVPIPVRVTAAYAVLDTLTRASARLQ